MMIGTILLIFGVLIFVPLIFGAVHIAQSAYDQTTAQKRGWEALAKPNNLLFRSGHLGTKIDLQGEFDGYPLTLDSLCDGNQHFTRVRVFREPSPSKRSFETPSISVHEIIRILKPYSLRRILRGMIYAEPNGTEILYHQPGIETDVIYLQTVFELLVELADAYEGIVALGGEAIEPLQKIATGDTRGLRPIASQLLYDVGQGTFDIASTHPLNHSCPRCLARFAIQKVRLTPSKTVSFYGCRQCHQSRQYWRGRLIAVLDQAMSDVVHHKPDQIRVNWLTRWHLFDFDAVEIGQVSDQEIVRFVRQISRAYDPDNPYRFRGMVCYLQPDASLSSDSLRLLKRVFGYVVQRAETTTISVPARFLD
ncbi:MAG: hypothetical protein AAF629_30930 [Chloroflexota bacterium]